MKESGPIFWQEVENRAPLALVLRGAEESARFEKNRVNWRLFPHNARPDFYRIAGIDLGGKVADHTPINTYVACFDQLFDFAPRAEAGGCKKTIHAHRSAK